MLFQKSFIRKYQKWRIPMAISKEFRKKNQIICRPNILQDESVEIFSLNPTKYWIS